MHNACLHLGSTKELPAWCRDVVTHASLHAMAYVPLQWFSLFLVVKISGDLIVQ